MDDVVVSQEITAVATPTFSLAEGTYTGSQSVSISCSTSGATIHYTTDGTTPTTSSPTYSSAISVSATTTIKAIGVKSGLNNSAVASATYTIAAAKPTFSPAAGMFTPGSAPDVTINCATSGVTIHYTTDGTTPTTSSAVYSSSIPVRQTTTIKAIAVKAGLANSEVASAEYVISSTLTATYTVYSTSYVTTSGTTPSGSSVSYSQTYTNTACQMTSGNSMTLTLSGYQGKKITGLVLSMKSNSSGGRGYMYMDAGSTRLTSIGNPSNPNAEQPKFSDDDWYGAWSTTYVNVTPTMSNDDYCIQQGENVVIYIHATTNSLYCRSFTLYYEDDTEPKINANDPQTLAYDATSGAFDYSITNPVTGTSLQVVSNSDWITNPQVGASQVTFTTTVNDTGLERTGTITLSYGTVTKTITVTQAAIAPVITTSNVPADAFAYTGGNDSFDYTITNPVSGAAVTVTSSNWITATVSGNTVNFQVAENNNVARSGEITLTYAKNGTTLATATVTVDQESNPSLPGSADNPYTVAEALEIISGYSNNQTSDVEVYVTGLVSQIDQIEVVQYHNATYYITDNETSTAQLQVFRGKYIHNTDFLSEDELLLGDRVVVKGKLKKYHSSTTTSSELDAGNYIVSLSRAVQPVTFNPVSCVTPSLTVYLFTESLYEGYNAQIYYTTNGADPKTYGIPFDDAWDAFLELTATTTIKAVTYIPELDKWSGVTEATYTIVGADEPGWRQNPYSVSQALAALDQNNNIKGAYVHGIVSRIVQIETTQYFNATYFISDDGEAANELQVYRGKYIARGDFTSSDQLLPGDEVTVFGDLTIYGSANPVKEFKPKNFIEDWYRPTSIMINPSQFNFSCNATSGLIDVLYSDDILVNVNNPTVQLCDANGDAATYDWIEVSLSQENGWDLEYAINANAGDESRTAYVKVLCQGQNLESNLVSITQSEYQVDFATLDFYFNGVRAEVENTVGLTGVNLDTDYAASTSPTTRLKFSNKTAQDGTILESSLVLKIDEVPGILSYDIKGNDFSGGTFCLIVSNNGVRYDTISTYKSTAGPGITTLPVNGLLHDTIFNLPATTRYIKWVYVTKNDGNVGLGNIRLNKPITQYDIVINNPMVGDEQIGTIYTNVLTTPMTAAEGTNVGLSINYSSSYYFVEWVVTDDSDNLVPVEENHFIMPASNVTVTATLVEANSPCSYAFSANGEVGTLLSSTVGSVIQMPTGTNITFNGQTFTFRGWTANPNDVTHLLRPGASYTLSQNTTFHAVYYQTVVGLTAEKHYAKVTSNLSDWSGEYLIVYEDGGVAFNGGLDPLDAVSNTIPVTISNGVILATETLDAAEFTITAVEGGYTIRSASGKYIGKLADSNGLNENASIQYVNSISYYDFGGSYGGEVDIIGSGGAYMRFNTTSNQTRFRYYSSSTFTNYKGIQLYRYVGSVSNLYTRIFMNVTADNIAIEGPSLVPNGSVLNVTTISNNLGADRLLIDEGGQLVTSNNANASVRKFITPYQQQQGKDNYYLIASPVNNLNPATAGMTGSNFDLYAFDQSAQGEEWQNYKADAFTVLETGKGYLYANNYGGFINMGGTMAANASAVTITNVSGKPFAGWNLIGNPYPCNVTIEKPFYRLAEGGAALATVATDESVAIAPMEGVFVCADGTETVGFTKASDISTTSGRNLLSMRVSRNRSSKNECVDTDNAIVRFGEGAQLRKLVLNPDLSQLYVAQDGTDYAIVNAETEGEMPLNFRPSENGSYTISVAAEGVEMNYLHLIDHKTGADVNLLQTPYYTFESKTGDYESRFMLVFSVGASTNDETFAFYNGSQWVVSSDGEATLQIIDMMGRVLSSQNVNGDAEVDIQKAAGVYLLRLMKGDDVKVQKIIIQ